MYCYINKKGSSQSLDQSFQRANSLKCHQTCALGPILGLSSASYDKGLPFCPYSRDQHKIFLYDRNYGKIPVQLSE